ncbi:hypothetical protein [Streptomonospora arabica]|uniref:DUF1918 domain-containing protein n=1 Tax=Streptomonospora arabica TaxID=412417 RepID=A0ABV9SSN4_9ACTN
MGHEPTLTPGQRVRGFHTGDEGTFLRYTSAGSPVIAFDNAVHYPELAVEPGLAVAIEEPK